MRACNTGAGTRDLKGDSRRSFMSDCLAGRTPPTQTAAAPATQQDRMRSCNAEAGTRSLVGDPRRAFMSDCLSGRSATGGNASGANATAQPRTGGGRN